MFTGLAKILRLGRWHHMPTPVAHVSRSNRLPAMTWLSRPRPAGAAIFRSEADYG
jgi:hypothetical protein